MFSIHSLQEVCIRCILVHMMGGASDDCNIKFWALALRVLCVRYQRVDLYMCVR
jgi:hypothetical protein